MKDIEMTVLLKQFNTRNAVAFGRIYSLLYDEIFHYASKLYRNTEIYAGDVVQDIFIKIWQDRKQEFKTIINIRAYIYVAVRNNFKDYLIHKKCIDKYNESLVFDNDLFVIEIAEGRLLSIIDQAMDVLPKDCAEVLKYYLEGWQIKDIAILLNKPERTVYNKKYETIEILKKKLPKSKIYIIFLMNCIHN